MRQGPRWVKVLAVFDGVAMLIVVLIVIVAVVQVRALAHPTHIDACQRPGSEPRLTALPVCPDRQSH